MSFSHRLEIRQAQSLVMTPQLLQAIRLLQMSSLELSAWISDELERNPFLEAESPDSPARQAEDSRRAGIDNAPVEGNDAAGAQTGERPWDSTELETSRAALESSLDASLDNTFDPDGPSLPSAGSGALPASHDRADDMDPLARLAAAPDLREHLRGQLGAARADAQVRLIAAVLIDAITDAGYLDADMAADLDGLASRLGVARPRVDAALALVQSLDPPGVGARDLAECLAIQLREKDRFDPAMAALVARLDLAAKRDFAALRRICGVDEADLADMLQELRALEPRPGRPFETTPMTPLVADALVRRGAGGDWIVELNSDALPRVLVNRAYYARVARAARGEAEKAFVSDAWQNASWLNRSLDQRARTILAVATEIVRQQQGFFAHGVAHLRPMTLKSVADAIGMHESTVSRVTANKSLGCERGVFEMKYFFSAAIAAAGAGEAHAAEAVRHRLRQLIDAEKADAILSDDALVGMLRADGVDIARRTVAKYRESLRIPSSVERRRRKGGAG